MNWDDFDGLLQKGDPGGPDQVTTEREAWDQLVSRRAQRRQNLILFATAALILLASGVGWVATRDGDGALIADVSSQDKSENPDHIAGSQPTPDSRATAVRDRTVNESAVPETLDPEDAKPSSPVEAFATYVSKADSEKDLWRDAVDEIRAAEVAQQRKVIDLVPRLKDPALRKTAMNLVCEAAGASSWDVLNRWLARTSTRREAWERLVGAANVDQCAGLVDIARTETERELLCRRLISMQHSKTLDVLTQLALFPQWRSAIRRGVTSLSPDQVHGLMMRMRSRDRSVQLSSAFILASLPGDTVERVASSMILGGRYRHPAYLVLLSRATPQSIAFLTSASARRDLSPALVSARHHFSTFEGHLKQWLLDSNGETDEPQTKQDCVGHAAFAGRMAGGEPVS